MIIQTAPDGKARFAITMDEHTALAGALARAFGNETFEPVQPRDLLLFLISNHDKGWAKWDAAPDTDPRTGLPHNLVDTPAQVITGTSGASADFNERHHPYCGLLSSMHSWGLYNGRYGMSDLVLINTIAPKDRHLADRMLDGELQRQARLKARLAEDPETASWIEEKHLFQNYKQLQFFDTLALYFNRTHEGARTEATFKNVPVSSKSDAAISVQPLRDGIYQMSPYPFSKRDVEFSFSGRYLEPRTGTSPFNWGAVLAQTPRQMQSFRIVAG